MLQQAFSLLWCLVQYGKTSSFSSLVLLVYIVEYKAFRNSVVNGF